MSLNSREDRGVLKRRGLEGEERGGIGRKEEANQGLARLGAFGRADSEWPFAGTASHTQGIRRASHPNECAGVD